MTYHVQATAERTVDGFPYFSHHDSVSALWRDKWRGPCSRGIYPFTDAWIDQLLAGVDPSSAR